MRNIFFIVITVLAISACKQPDLAVDIDISEGLVFKRLSGTETGIDFINELTLNKDLDVFRYRNYYNGGGVAIGDINGDGLADIFLTSNMHKNKLYLNLGNFKFKDITEAAGVGGTKMWSTGVSMADVNGDGLLDIYVCNSGDVFGGNRENELYINKGDLTFEESAEKYGLHDKGFGTHAVFFDYDQDGDLDCYVLNNSFRPVSSLGLENIRHVRDSTGADKLYRNDNNSFVDVSEQAGIYGSVIGFGLGVTITDVNLDNLPDIYVSNDFFERDYLYINQGNGTFKDELVERLGLISNFSMGTDAGDLNNDGSPEIFVTDMLPDNNQRLKTTTNFESYNLFQQKIANDYYEQYMRNTLQLNSGKGYFKEVAQFAGVAATDWSWGALLADFDKDGYKEIFVTNGIYKDVTDQDFIEFLASDEMMIPAMRSGKVNFEDLVNKMPSTRLSNYLFKRESSLSYSNQSRLWGLDEPSFSNGAAYADLDNDGDLDLVVNNVNQELFVYKNLSENTSNSSITFALTGPSKNQFAIGARINLFVNDEIIMHENIPTKGFQSSMDYKIIMGCGQASEIDSLEIFWGYNRYTKLYNVPTNQKLSVHINDAGIGVPAHKHEQISEFKKVDVKMNPPFRHEEDGFVDFDRERLIYHMLSREGPALAAADVNNDGRDDFYIGGAHGKPGSIYLQQPDGSFKQSIQQDLINDLKYEDVDAVFFDADGDGDLDLYVVSGGYVFPERSSEYFDRLYINESSGSQLAFKRYIDKVPSISVMGSCVQVGDYDNDGDLDLFIGGRAVPGKYGLSADSYLLQNDGKGKFTDVTSRVAPRMKSLGMVTDAQWVDFDNDGDLDLVIVGEWMPITLFKNNGTNLERLNNIPGLVKSDGWWNTIEIKDVNNDGNIDFILGNWGLNSKFKASEDKPFTLFVNDFDNNGTLDHIFAQFEGDSIYPVALRNDLISQMPGLKKRFFYHKDYANKTVADIFGREQLKNSIVKSIYKLESCVAINNGDGTYSLNNLPQPVQFSPVFSIHSIDQDRIMFGGNFYGVKPEEGRYDANSGIVLRFNEYGDADVMDDLGLRGEARSIRVLKGPGNRRLLIVARNNNYPSFYEF
ncbi:MAG: VCBS repeat-containing protein [Cyclobacteriaceae bacterium]|nr:VCBS repeat-containing protein [Cyclobacteriaceae bacterium]